MSVLALRKASWRERGATAAVFLANGIGIGAWAASVPSLKIRLMLTDGSLSIVLLTFALGAVVAMLVSGLLASRIGRRRAVRSAMIVFGLALVPPFLTASLLQLAAAAFILGAANGALDVAMNAYAVGVERRWGGAIMSSFQAAFSTGGLVGAGLGAAIPNVGMAPCWIMDIAAVLIGLIAAMAWTSLASEEAVESAPTLALPGRFALALCVAALVCMMCEGAIADWSGVYLRTVAHSAAATAATGYGAFSIAMLVGRLMGDRIVQMLGSVRVVRLGALTAACGLALSTALPVPLLCILGFALVGFGLSNVVPALFSVAAHLGASPTAGIAMVATAGYTGFLIGPPIIGATASVAGLRAGIALLIASAILLALLAGVLRTHDATRA